jgi:hypothetical protein|tara:strand:+ start:654 stop:899 length:246 start_codon:yes stop_codon:yes gene_type:complete
MSSGLILSIYPVRQLLAPASLHVAAEERLKLDRVVTRKKRGKGMMRIEEEREEIRAKGSLLLLIVGMARWFVVLFVSFSQK